MSRRVATLSVAGFLVVFLTAVAALLPVPYVLLGPGPTSNTLGSADGEPLIRISDRTTYPTSGHLELTTVSVSGGPGHRVDLMTALRGWLDRDVAVVPQDHVFRKGQTEQEVEEENAEEMHSSQTNATAAALRELDIPITPIVVVQAVAKGSAALGKLKAGDQIVAVDGRPTATPDAVRAGITAHKPGEPVAVTVRRGGVERTETVTTKAAEDDRAVIGIVPAVSFDYPFKVEISLEDVGGPSAGLMFALGIVDKLTPGELTGGRFIAGTGTIDPDGKVGPIGGIQQKLAAARDAGAAVFLTPADNCAEAMRAVPDGLKLVKVTSLDGAVAAVDTVRTGKGTLPACPR